MSQLAAVGSYNGVRLLDPGAIVPPREKELEALGLVHTGKNPSERAENRGKLRVGKKKPGVEVRECSKPRK